MADGHGRGCPTGMGMDDRRAWSARPPRCWLGSHVPPGLRASWLGTRQVARDSHGRLPGSHPPSMRSPGWVVLMDRPSGANGPPVGANGQPVPSISPVCDFLITNIRFPQPRRAVPRALRTRDSGRRDDCSWCARRRRQPDMPDRSGDRASGRAWRAWRDGTGRRTASRRAMRDAQSSDRAGPSNTLPGMPGRGISVQRMQRGSPGRHGLTSSAACRLSRVRASHLAETQQTARGTGRACQLGLWPRRRSVSPV